MDLSAVIEADYGISVQYIISCYSEIKIRRCRPGKCPFIQKCMRTTDIKLNSCTINRNRSLVRHNYMPAFLCSLAERDDYWLQPKFEPLCTRQSVCLCSDRGFRNAVLCKKPQSPHKSEKSAYSYRSYSLGGTSILRFSI
jgi:hypothetical protein